MRIVEFYKVWQLLGFIYIIVYLFRFSNFVYYVNYASLCTVLAAVSILKKVTAWKLRRKETWKHNASEYKYLCCTVWHSELYPVEKQQTQLNVYWYNAQSFLMVFGGRNMCIVFEQKFIKINVFLISITK